MYEIIVEGTFSATHSIRSADGSRENLHGHDWHVWVHLVTEELNATGTVADFEEVRARLQEVVGELDRSNLNEHEWLEGLDPTAERVAGVIFRRMVEHTGWGGRVHGVRIGEARGCVAGYFPGLPTSGSDAPARLTIV